MRGLLITQCVISVALSGIVNIAYGAQKLPAIPYLGYSIPQEGRHNASGAYLAPNENLPQNFEAPLREKKGALIGVGSFRVFNDAAYGDFSHVICMDYDEIISDFNRTNAELVKLSKDRFEYLGHLFGHKPPPSLLEAARKGEITNEVYLKKLLALPPLEHQEEPLVLRQFKEKSTQMVRWDGAPPIAPEFLIRESGELEDRFREALLKPGAKVKYWESDELFSRLKRTLKEKSFIAITGNYAGDNTIPVLAQALRAKNVKVGAIDLSNILEHLAEAEISPKETVLKNLNLLPWEDNGVVLFTETYHRTHLFPESEWLIEGTKKEYGDMWKYFGIDHESFKVALRDGIFEKYDSSLEWISKQLKGRKSNFLGYYALGKLAPKKKCLTPVISTYLEAYAKGF